MVQIYNTYTGQIDRFKPIREPDIRLYTCGPTVYNYAHLGNLSTYLVSDIVVRSLRFLGYRVQAVMNITDIDDKTIRDSQQSGEKLLDFTEKYTELFNEDLARLSIDTFDSQHPISEHIDAMVDIIQKLLDLGHAYISEDGSVYYKVDTFSGYEKLANLDLSGMKTSVRIDNDEYEKDAASDFVLWKAYDALKDGDNSWSADFSVDGSTRTLPGRPGWHIECSGVIQDVFKGQIDIHMGGCDLIFPHHTNEIAQSQPLLTKKQGKFCGYWMHAGHLLVDNKKMSKSAGNFYTLSDIVDTSEHSEEMTYRGIRMMRLMSGYRENFNFTFDKLDSSVSALGNFDTIFRRISNYVPQGNGFSRDIRDMFQACMQDFVSCLEDDFDTVSAMALIFDFVRQCNALLDSGGFSEVEIESLMDFFRSLDQVFGVMDFGLFESLDIPDEITHLADRRLAAKIEKNYELADSLRTQIGKQGYEILDTAQGYSLELK